MAAVITPTSSSATNTKTATNPSAPAKVDAAYEDMFKEITRKLYGEETGNGLHTLGNTPVAQVVTANNANVATPPEGAGAGGEQRSFTNLQQIDRAATIEYDQQQTTIVASTSQTAVASTTNVVLQQQQTPDGGGSVVVATTATTGGGNGNFKSEDHHLSTAFGLAALMQNGFTMNNAGQQQQQQQQTNVTVGGVDQTQQVLQWSTGGKMQSYNSNQQQQQQMSTPKSKSQKNRIEQHSTPMSSGSTPESSTIYISPPSGLPQQQQQQQTTPTTSNATQAIAVTAGSNSTSSTSGSSRKKSNGNQQHQQNSGVQKRYACTHCPYSTDRRDLYTRHENIHKDEKPFQCYACLKQFNRADHVKKHFLRMHREMEYDINKTRRHVPSTSSSHHHRGNIHVPNATLNSSTSSNNGSSDVSSTEQKPNIFHAANVTIDHAFLESQRQPTSSSLSIAETIEAVATAADVPLTSMKQEKVDDGSAGGTGANGKPKREKRFTCCYCPWSGADKWGLKRHLNTHTKPFVCLLCDYKAARSERLATHVLKVHNKRACSKCSFLADTQEEFQTHLNEVHLLKMDAISRNTASVAQDFHKAGGVQELKLPASGTPAQAANQLLFNNKLPTQWTTREAAAFLHSLAMQQHQQLHQQQHQLNLNGNKRIRQHSCGVDDDEDEHTPSSSASSTTSSSMEDSGVSPMKQRRFQLPTTSPAKSYVDSEQKKAMTAFLSSNFDLHENATIATSSSKRKHHLQHNYNDEDQENQQQHRDLGQLIKSPPAFIKYNVNYSNNSHNKIKSTKSTTTSTTMSHRLDLPNANNNNNRFNNNNNHDKENSLKAVSPGASPATFLNDIEYQNLNKIVGAQFQNYVKDIISKYYAAESSVPLMFPAMPTATTTPQQSQQYEHLSSSPSNKCKRMLSETEEYIEYLKNKEDITLTITPKVAAASLSNNSNQNNNINGNGANVIVMPVNNNNNNHQKRQSPKKLQQHQPLFSATPRTMMNGSNGNSVNTNGGSKSSRKSLNQIATLLPLLADAASKQQYLTAPLDFSKKSAQDTQPHAQKEPNVAKASPTTAASPPMVTPETSNDSINSATNRSSTALDKRSSRKQAQPKKIRMPPEMLISMLRDKYLSRMMNKKLACRKCTSKQQKQETMMMEFNYHTKASLALHVYWKHKRQANEQHICEQCEQKFGSKHSLAIHRRTSKHVAKKKPQSRSNNQSKQQQHN